MIQVYILPHKEEKCHLDEEDMPWRLPHFHHSPEYFVAGVGWQVLDPKNYNDKGPEIRKCMEKRIRWTEEPELEVEIIYGEDLNCTEQAAKKDPPGYHLFFEYQPDTEGTDKDIPYV